MQEKCSIAIKTNYRDCRPEKQLKFPVTYECLQFVKEHTLKHIAEIEEELEKTLIL